MRGDAMGIADMFDAVVGLEDTGKTKPSRLPFRRALKLLRVRPSEAMHVGDWRDRDILGANRTGMKTCFARYGENRLGKKVWADHYIDGFEGLLSIIKDNRKIY